MEMGGHSVGLRSRTLTQHRVLPTCHPSAPRALSRGHPPTQAEASGSNAREPPPHPPWLALE